MCKFGVGKGAIHEIRYSVRPDDGKLQNFKKDRHITCILGALNTTLTVANPADNDAVLRQLTVSISSQTKEAGTANSLCREELDRQSVRDELKKDKLKKLHKSVKNMLMIASASDCDSTPDDLVE